MERGAMPHLKCVPCRARTMSGPAHSDVVMDLCASCGAPLERVTTLDEIVGFRSIQPAAVPQLQANAVALPVAEYDR